MEGGQVRVLGAVVREVAAPDGECTVAVRPENIALGGGEVSFTGSVEEALFVGSATTVFVRTPDGQRIEVRLPNETDPPRVGEQATFGFRRAAAAVFGAHGEVSAVMAGRRFWRKWTFWHWVTAVSLLVLAVVLVYPVGQLLIKSFVAKDGGFTLKNYVTFLSKRYYRLALTNSLWVCTVSTIIATAIGVPMAFLLTRYRLPGKPLIRTLIILSLLSPPFIGTYSWIVLLGRAGIITRAMEAIGITLPTIYGPRGIILVFSLHFFPYVYLFTSAALQSIDRSLEEAAANLGVNGWTRFRTVTLPLVLPAISAGALMAFMSALADFGTPQLIGEGFQLLPIAAYAEYMNEIGGNPGMAGALSMGLVVISAVALFLQRWVTRRSFSMSSLRPPEVVDLPLGRKILATAFCYLVVLVAILPQVVVVVSSFRKTKGPIFLNEFGLDNYITIFDRVPGAVANTFRLSTVAIVIMVIAGLLMAYVITRRRARPRRRWTSCSWSPTCCRARSSASRWSPPSTGRRWSSPARRPSSSSPT